MKFNTNAPFWQFMNTLARFTALNLVYLVTLIPIITIGPARAALYSTMFAYDEHDDVNLVREYLKRFKREFKQGLAAWVLVAILAAAILFGLSFWKAWDTNASYIPLILLVIAAVVVALFAEYAAPLQARFANTTGRLFSLSAMFPWRAFPCSLVLVIIVVIVIVIIVALVVDDVLLIGEVVADDVQAVAELHDLVGQVFDLEGDLIENVHNGAEQLAFVGIGTEIHAFHQALQIRNLLSDLHSDRSFQNINHGNKGGLSL